MEGSPQEPAMKAQKIVVLGGTGFVGNRLVSRLQRDGHAITVLSRNRDLHRELGVLPRVMVLNADVHDRSALARHLDGADAAINLVGILNERGSDGRGFRKAHVELTRTLIDACIDAQVPRLLQMSALRAGEGSSH
jgi:NADH dehydrogenase